MKTSFALACVSVTFVCAALSGRADYFWNGGVGKTNGWFDVGNAANTAYGTWWKDGTGTAWGAAPANGEGVIVKLNNGGTCVLPNDVSGLDGRLFVDAGANGTTESWLVIDEGAVISGLGICVSGPSSWYPGDGHLVVNGGNLTLGGGPANLTYGLQVGYSGKSGALGTAEINGGNITIVKGGFYVGTKDVSRGEIRVNGGTVESQVGFQVGVSGTVKYENRGLFEQRGGEVTITKSAVTDTSGGVMNLLGGNFAVSNNFSVLNGGICRVGKAMVSDEETSGTLTVAGSQTVYNDGLMEVDGGRFELLATGGLYAYDGGQMKVQDGSVLVRGGVRVYNGGVLEVNGGAFTSGTIRTSSAAAQSSAQGRIAFTGGEIAITGDLLVEQGGLVQVVIPLDETNPGALKFGNAGTGTNTIEILAGGSITRSGASGISYEGTESAFQHLVVTGGAFTNKASLTLGNAHTLIEVSDGGTFYVEPVNGYGNMTPGENKAYYFRIRGRAVANCGCWGVPSSKVTTTAFKGVENIIVEHVIEAGETSPLIARGGAGDSTLSAGNYIPGNQRIRPAGGVQVVSTNQFALFYSPKSATHTLNSEVYTSAPDATLWTSGELASYYWGCTLNAEAKIALARESKAAHVYESETFAARPMGYCELPKMGKDKLNGVSVALTVAAPEGGTLEGALASVKSGLESAGYTNVETNGVTGLTTFGVPLERIAEKSVDQKLLLDFTETPMPATGMMAHKVAANYAYPTVTNALFTAVAVTYDKPVEGLMLIVK